jgi:hypothetical protein
MNPIRFVGSRILLRRFALKAPSKEKALSEFITPGNEGFSAITEGHPRPVAVEMYEMGEDAKMAPKSQQSDLDFSLDPLPDYEKPYEAYTGIIDKFVLNLITNLGQNLRIPSLIR